MELQPDKAFLEWYEKKRGGKDMTEEFVRKLDDLGRVVLPVGIRKEMGWQERDALLIKQTSSTQVTIEKAYPTCFVCGATDGLVQIGETNICGACRDRLKDAKDGDKIDIEVQQPTTEE